MLALHVTGITTHVTLSLKLMNYDKLRCADTQIKLKTKSYQLQFHCSPGRVQEVERYIATHLTAAMHVETYACERVIDSALAYSNKRYCSLPENSAEEL